MVRILLLLFTVLSLPTSALSAEYKIDSGHTYTVFQVKHLGIAPNYGRFNVAKGTINFDAAGDTNSIALEIDAASVDTGNRKRDKHLRSDDFFDVKQFPTVTFKSSSWKKLTDTTFEVAGEVDFHGVKKPLTVTITKTGEGLDPWGNYRIGFTTTFKIDRFAHGVNGSKKGIGQFVEVTFTTEAVKQK